MNLVDLLLMRSSTLSNFQRGSVMTAAVAACGAIALGDAAAADRVSLRFLYVLPVVLAAWVGSPRWVAAFVATTLVLELWLRTLLDRPINGSVVGGLAVRGCVEALTALLVMAVRRQQLQLRSLALRDTLTGVLNRRGFSSAAEIEEDRCSRHGHPLSVAYFDLDHFKELNDELGHHAGDRLLVEFAHLLESTARATDIVASMGGDEFLVALPETDLRGAEDYARRISEAISRIATPGRETGATVGLALVSLVSGGMRSAVIRAEGEMRGRKAHWR